jgi:serine/threonine-protein kinase
MAIVYLAIDLRHQRDVAIKVLRPEFAMAIPTERFLREIQIEAQLKHPYILPLFDSGDADGLPFYVMPHVPSGSLRTRLNQESQLPLEEALRITNEMAEALSHAHAHGIVHRDVKPGNILLDENHALLADFGIARAVSALGGTALSQSGLVVGTPEYMSPEQGSEGAKIDGRSDLYALACVLYEMLSGEPPFTGATAQVVIARHMADQPRSLRVVRSTVPDHVEEAIRTALAKVPADRYPTAERFVAALRGEGSTTASVRARVARRRRWSAGLVGGVALAAGLGLWWFPRPPLHELDRNKVVLFPLTERSLAVGDSGAGYDVAVMLSAALEHTEPLRWIDGAQRLGQPATANSSILPAEDLRRVAEAQRAAYYIEGAVVGGARDSTTVILRLHDTDGDSLLAQESASASRANASPVQLGLTAATRLLPVLVDPGRRIDLGALASRNPSATALWIQGEREYRRSRFQDALGFYERALGQDSAMAFAAMKGAQAASWLNHKDRAGRLVEVALEDESSLPTRHRALARGLQAYWAGHADTALAWVRRALVLQPEWAEGHMVLGEVYYHLLPDVPFSLDSLARAEFARAAAADSGFAPPLFHLTEAALRQGDTAVAAALIERFRVFNPDSARWRQLAIMRDCVSGGPRTVRWQREASAHPLDVMQAARALSVGGAQNACAERGYRAILSNPEVSDFHWNAVQGLHGVVMSEGRYDEIVPLIDTAVANGHGRAPALYFLGVLAGAPFEARAAETDSIWRGLYGEHYEVVSPQTRWLLATWHAHRQDTVRVRMLRDALLADSQAARLPIRAALDGHLALAQGDTLTAMRQFQGLRVDAATEDVEQGLMEPLAIERLLLARLALARGDFARAGDMAGTFDHAGPVTFLAFIPAALEIRLRAARALGRSDLVRRYKARLHRLQAPEVTALGL